MNSYATARILANKVAVVSKECSVNRGVLHKIEDAATLKVCEIPLLHMKLKRGRVNAPHLARGNKGLVKDVNFLVTEDKLDSLEATRNGVRHILNSYVVGTKVGNVCIVCVVTAKKSINCAVLVVLCLAKSLGDDTVVDICACVKSDRCKIRIICLLKTVDRVNRGVENSSDTSNLSLVGVLNSNETRGKLGCSTLDCDGLVCSVYADNSSALAISENPFSVLSMLTLS